jgi:cysteinyl-tRNA synthetase
MGHARCYISFDIIRRVLMNYFNYEITFVQNITDIDDKIIKRARQNYLWDEFINQINNQNNHQNNNLSTELENAKVNYQLKINNEKDELKKQMMIKQLQLANELIINNSNSDNQLIDPIEFELKAKNVFIDYLDELKGNEITNNEIFTSLPRLFENDFYEDMNRLNVLRPTHSPRVSEYIEEIIEFIDKIIENGYAYRSELSGSVYFNTITFNNNPIHKYGKLAPEAINDQQLLEEGEGDLSSSKQLEKEKLNLKDFALWKSSKNGEPKWSSKWCEGRPGWHIECSTMAFKLLGSQLDIHSGGIDLRFPHHENEIAQSESYFNSGQNWIQFFLHTGHLHIEGCKMSKSLKNFISIKDALKVNSSRQIRLAFLLHNWEDSLDYSRKTMEEAIAYEKTFKEFFFLIEDQLRNYNKEEVKWSELEEKLELELIRTSELIDDYLCDNINTKSTLIQLSNLINSVNCYFKDKKGIKIEINLIKQIAIYITKLLKIFGLIDDNQNENEIGFTSTTTSSNNYNNKKEIIYPYVKVLSEFREKVRELGKEMKSTELLSLCDELRDKILPSLAVKLDDKEIGENGKLSTLIKIDDDDLNKKPEELRKEIELKWQLEEKLKLEKQLEKEKKRNELARIQAEKEEEKKRPPNELFIRQLDKYSKFDELGLPTHDQTGKELSQNQRKKLMNLYQKQAKKYEDYIKSIKL